MRAPLAERITGGVPPTPSNARTGELTPPGNALRARASQSLERSRSLMGSAQCSERSVEETP
jgi:hypothetical protein